MFPALRSEKWAKGSAYFFLAFVVSLPLQTKLLVHQAAWGRGFLNPYATINFTIQDLFLVLSGLCLLIAHKKKQWKRGEETFFWMGLLALSTVVLSLLISPGEDQFFHLLLGAKVVAALLIYLLVVNHTVKQHKILEFFIGAMTVEASLAIFQVFTQSSLGLTFLGEPHLAQTTAHLAKISWGGLEWIRAYGTFPHPNVLGGFLVISILATFLYTPKKDQHRKLLLAVQLLGLIASFSRSAFLALIVCLLILRSRQWTWALFSLFCILFWSRGILPWSDPAILNRWQGFKDALLMFQDHPFGVGWSHYTLFMDETVAMNLQPWEYQPVHNIYLLFLAETGIFGLIFLSVAVFFGLKKIMELHKKLSTPLLTSKKRIYTLMGVSALFIGLFDHYWISLEQGRYLLILLWGIFSYFMGTPLYFYPIRKGASKK